MKSATVILETQGLELHAGGRSSQRLLLKGLSFRVRTGECWVVLGPNGAGKSTLLATLAGVWPVPEGRLELEGRPLDRWCPEELAARRAWCPQFWSDPFAASVAETAGLARHRGAWGGWSGSSDDPELQRVLERLDLAKLADADVRTLSGGERQRVAIAAAVLQGAPLLLLDEPSAHLDWAHQRALRGVLREHAQAGGAVLASLHDLGLAWDLATHAVLLDGRGQAWAGLRGEVMTPERLGAAFGVSFECTEAGGNRRFWAVDALEAAE